MKVAHSILLFLFIGINAFGQSITGFIYDENNTPVPFANVYIKNLQKGTASDGEGKYFYQFQQQGTYDVVVKVIGFEPQEFKIILDNNKTTVKNIYLKQDIKELNEIIVKGKERDPAYGIIRNAINNREKWNSQISSSSCKVYIKAKEIISERERKKRARKEKQKKVKQQNSKEEVDVFETEKQERLEAINKIASGTNMLEINMQRNYQYPNKVKEVRSAYKKYGDTYGLFFNNTLENDFNFYDGLLVLPKLNKVPLVSPLNSISFITYKFELIETTFLGKKMLYKIKMIPRKKGNSTFNGFVWIQDETFHLHKVDLEINGGGLLIYDDFSINQTYQFINDTIIVPNRQEFNYESKNRKRKFKGRSVVQYSDYVLDTIFKKNYFSNEVGVTTKDAYKRDSSYWDEIRPEPLTKEEIRFQKIKDSLYDYLHSDAYLDSADSVYNRITLFDVLWDSFRFTNRKKKRYWGISSLAGMWDPFEPAGVRVGPYGYYFKKFKDETFINSSAQINFSVLNWDPKGYMSNSYRYDPMHNGYINLYFGRQFDLVVTNDAVSNLLVRNNWIENDNVILSHTREYINGFYIETGISVAERRSIEGYNFISDFDSLFGDNSVQPFSTYQATNLDVVFSYTPFQKYMTEPNRKVILGSRWPTFSLGYTKGVNGLFGSDINFDFFEAQIKQNFQLATLGTSAYKVSGGKFTNTNDLRYVDYKIFPRGDRWFFASLMQSMQIQDTSLNVTESYLKAHFTHNFNGAIINFVPLIKRLGIHTVIGTSGLYITESNYRYLEWFAGVERTFRLDRRRLRLGVYVVDAVSNYSGIQPRIKFALNLYSIRDNTWGY